MKTKRYVVLLLMTVLLSQYHALSQTTTTELGREWSDTSKISVVHMAQHNEFLNNQFPYPAKPRNMWELGLNGGLSFVVGDVNSTTGYGWGASLRKAFDHTFSWRFNYNGSWNYGEPSLYGINTGQFQYKNLTHHLGFDIIASLNTASNYRGNPKTNVYVLAGYSLSGSKVYYKKPTGPFAQDGGYNIFYGIGDPNSQDGLLNTWFGANINGRQSFAIWHALNLGGGIAFKITDRVNLGLEQKFHLTMPGYDYLDGYKAANNNDFLSYTSARLNINIGNSSRRVQPLWWINPNNYVYSELNMPRHMKIPPVVLPDGDGDGVTDQFDLQPNTPRGAPVDTHGVTKDTDGDGVPDFRDKELLTLQTCFPVNADGVGTCPEPACCKEIRDLMASRPITRPSDCAIGSLPSIEFRNNSATLSRDAQNILASVASRVNMNPNCKIKVIGYGAASKNAQQMSWERVNAVIKYLVERQGIAENRFIFSYGQDGVANTVDLQGTTEEGPNTVPSPYPNLRRN